MANAKGRLAEAYTGARASPVTDLGFSYSARGETTDTYELTPHSGAYYHVNASYWANGALSALNPGVGLPNWTYGADGEGRSTLVSASSGVNPISAASYNAFGPAGITFGSADSDSFKYDSNTGRQTSYTFNVGSQSMVSNLTWNANGTLQTLVISDPFNSSNNQTCESLYDDLSRLASHNCGPAWGQSFSYDPFGNISKTALGVNLVNGGFESGSLAGWQGWGTSIGTVAHSGSYALVEAPVGAGSDDVAYQDIYGLSPGQTYHVSAWVKASASGGQVTLQAHDTMGNNSVTDVVTPGTSWQQLSVIFTATSTAAIRVHLWEEPGSESTYWDDVSVTPGFGSNSLSFQPTYNTATNRYSTLPGGTPTYDANGNLLNDGFHTYTWDAESKNITVDSGVTMTYDALGRWVERQTGSTYTEAVYSPLGNRLAQMNGQTVVKAFVPLPGGAVAEYGASGLTSYWHPDWLGTPRLYSSPGRTVTADVAYAPFGEQYVGTAQDTFFTGVAASDEATDMKDFLAREFHSTQGRWLTPDPAGVAAADPTNPQSWNRYAYVGNNPLAVTDPTGTCAVFIAGVTQGYDPNTAFTQIANQFGADQAYPYAGLTIEGSVIQIATNDSVASTTALQAIQTAINNESGLFDIIAYSGGAEAFTSAYNSLSPADQQRIGQILYLSPGANGDIASNDDTTTYWGTGKTDTVATLMTVIPPWPIGTKCAHTDFACLMGAASAEAQFAKNNGPCTTKTVVSRPNPKPAAPGKPGGIGVDPMPLFPGGGGISGGFWDLLFPPPSRPFVM